MWIGSLLVLVLLSLYVQSASIVKANDNYWPLSIIHTNDFHARFEETNNDSTQCKERLGQVCIGGYARMLTVVQQLLTERKPTNAIYLNIGDNFQGTLWYEMFGWNVTSTFLNLLVADATTLGNHEFDRGIEGVVPFMQTLKSPIVASNIDDSLEPTFQNLYKKSEIIVRDGRKIGLVGAVVAATMEISSPGKLIFLNEIESVRQEADRLKAEDNVDIIVVLSHCGLVIDRQMALEGGLNIDVIVGGHSHTFLYNGTDPGPDRASDTYPIVVQQTPSHKVLIVQASAYAKYVGDLIVYFDEDGELQEHQGNPIFLSNDIVEDPDIIEALKPWKEAVDLVGNREVGIVKTQLNRADCAFEECNFGNFVTDSFVDYFINDPEYQEEGSWAYATIGMTNAGGIRTTISPGIVTYDDLFTALPFQNTIDSFELRGDHLKDSLEFAASAYTFYNFMTFSGMKVTFNVTRPEFDRVISVDVLCRQCEIPKYEPLDLTKSYRMLVPSFIAGGGNNFTMFGEFRTNFKKGKAMDIEVVEEYMRKRSPVIQKKDGRCIILK